jgi:hypothetical protein
MKFITTADLNFYKKYIKISALVEAAGLNKETITSKISRKNELLESEIIALTEALDKAGITLKLPAPRK